MNEKKLGILLVEDDQIDQINVKRAFKKNNLNHHLYIAENGEEGLKMLRDNRSNNPPINLVLTDVNMPLMNGIEMIQEIRKDNALKKLAVFVLTTSKEDSDRIDSYELNVSGYIIKPLSFDHFIKTIKSLNEFWQINEYPDL